MIEVKNVSVNYGAIEAVKDVSLTVSQGEIVTLIGANGAGKSTLLKAITGIESVTEGELLYCGEPLGKVSVQKRVKNGIALVPEGRRVFGELTLLENLEMGAYTEKNRRKNLATFGEIYERFPILKERRHQEAKTLSGGEQQMLAMGRALMSHPQLLLLDEPSMGLAPIYIEEIFSLIQSLRDSGMTILVIEQNAKAALSIADRAYVLENGRVILEGKGTDLLESAAVQKAYLGG